MEKLEFQAPRTMHCYTLGTTGPETKHCWLALHGYGQLARYFLRRFDVIAGPDTVVVAPEAAARFYLDAEGKSVGASWMTREHRLTDIEDNLIYLNELYARLTATLPPECRFVAFGFSQGCATLMRWVLHTQPPLRALILYAGSIPEDLPYAAHREYLAGFPVFLVYGDQDEYLTPTATEEYMALLDRIGLEVQVRTFAGTHAVEREVLRGLKEVI
jgi:predicted esterase